MEILSKNSISDLEGQILLLLKNGIRFKIKYDKIYIKRLKDIMLSDDKDYINRVFMSVKNNELAKNFIMTKIKSYEAVSCVDISGIQEKNKNNKLVSIDYSESKNKAYLIYYDEMGM